MGPTLNKNNKNIKSKNIWFQTETGRECFIYFIFIFYRFSLRYTEIGSSEFIGARRKVLYSTRATLGNQKHEILLSFQLKIRKILCFDFSYLRLSDGQNWSEQEANLIHTSRARREYQNFGVSSNSTRYEFFV